MNRGLAGRRAVARWAWRMFRREWRQQALVLALLAFTVAAAVLGIAAGDNLAPSTTATLGSAHQRLMIDGSDPAALRANIALARHHLGPVEIVSHEVVPIPGSADRLDVRGQDPHGRYGASTLGLRSGHWPHGTGEVALTPQIAQLYKVRIGSHLTVGNHRYTVVGIVENPQKLDDRFALTSPGAIQHPMSVSVLAAASDARFDAYKAARTDPVPWESRTSTAGQAAATAILAMATAALLLVSLVAAAGFAAVAQRRLRQVGMLSALGATDRHVRLALLAHGALVGAIAAAIGGVAGTTGWFVLAPHLAGTAGHRIDRYHLPWSLLLIGLVVAVATPTAAAWWPGRAVAKVPTMAALSARPPRPTGRYRTSALAALACLALGVGCLVKGNQRNAPLMMAGTVALAAGILLVSPLAIRALTALSGGTPFTVRLALRDLRRHQARSGAALAAISLALGIAVALVGTMTAARRTAGPGNLPADELMVRIGVGGPLLPDTSQAQLDAMRTAVDRYAATLDHADVVPLERTVDATAPAVPASGDDPGGLPATVLGWPIGSHTFNGTPLYLLTPEVARHFGLDPAAAAGVEVLTSKTGKLEYINVAARRLEPTAKTVHLPNYSDSPAAFITPDAARQHGWTVEPAGWLIESAHPLTGDQVASARQMAAGSGLTVRARHDESSLVTARAGVTAAGALLALAVLAMTVGTIRGEAAGELRTLTAAGATRAVRRGLTAVTAGVLALGGVLLGAAGAYLALLGAYAHRLHALAGPPYVELATALVGVPLLAAAAGWLLGGREPGTLARRLLE